MKMKCHTHFNLMYCYYLFFLSFLTAVNCNVHSQSVVQAQDGSNILTVVLNADFKSQKYMTSIEMGQICHNFVLDNMKLFSFTNVDEVYILRTANDICSHYAAENGREYVAIDFLRSLYPYVRRNELTNIFDKYMTDKNSFFHNYGAIYHKHLSPYRDKVGLRYLELGVLGGASLNAMHEYFPHADRFVGIDINPDSKVHQDKTKDIYVHIGSQDDPEFLTHVNDMHGPFDVILDDASHIGSITIESFKILFPKLKNGGLYIVEDTVAFRDELAYFQDLIRYGLNNWRFDKDVVGVNDHCVDPFKMNRFASSNHFDKETYNKNLIYSSIGEITYSNSCILISKDVKYHWLDNLNMQFLE